jgi:hypothetical protein
MAEGAGARGNGPVVDATAITVGRRSTHLAPAFRSGCHTFTALSMTALVAYLLVVLPGTNGLLAHVPQALGRGTGDAPRVGVGVAAGTLGDGLGADGVGAGEADGTSPGVGEPPVGLGLGPVTPQPAKTATSRRPTKCRMPTRWCARPGTRRKDRRPSGLRARR